MAYSMFQTYLASTNKVANSVGNNHGLKQRRNRSSEKQKKNDVSNAAAADANADEGKGITNKVASGPQVSKKLTYLQVLTGSRKNN